MEGEPGSGIPIMPADVNTHLGPAWEIAVISALTIVICAVITVIIIQIRRKRTRKTRRRSAGDHVTTVRRKRWKKRRSEKEAAFEVIDVERGEIIMVEAINEEGIETEVEDEDDAPNSGKPKSKRNKRPFKSRYHFRLPSTSKTRSKSSRPKSHSPVSNVDLQTHEHSSEDPSHRSPNHWGQQ